MGQLNHEDIMKHYFNILVPGITFLLVNAMTAMSSDQIKELKGA